MDYSDYNIQFIKGVGDKRAQLFNKLGVYTLQDLINYYPRKYIDWSKTLTVKEVKSGEPAFIKATMITPVKEAKIRKGLTLYKCNFTDGETVIHVTIFNNAYLAKALRTFDDYILYGKVDRTFTEASMSSPQIEKAEKATGIEPIYPATTNLSSKIIEKVVRAGLDKVGAIPDTLPEYLLTEYNLCSLNFAIRQIHFPDKEENIEIARRRLIFEELLTLQLGLMKLKSKRATKNLLKMPLDFSEEFYSLLPFNPTNAQKKAVADCIADLNGDRQMNRLVQGDVGSGKTAVAGAVMYTVIKNGYQTAMMAPTEILTTQHYESFCKLFDGTDIKIALLTGSTKATEKKKIKLALYDGEIDLIIGTHALIQNDVEFKNLGLVCTDEQHRFGVEQRSSLAMKGNNPHLLVMSATPIPRTMGLIIYGDLNISVLDELPPGRQEIRTDLVTSAYHQRIYKFIKNAVDNGNQAYIVCSLVDDNDSDLLSAKEYADKLSTEVFQGYNLGLLHGKMKPKEKDKVMQEFAKGNVQILVSTTVVEVGVDVPNATVMMIENAERFGLAQLHQLRGRVGRGKYQSYCIFMTGSKAKETKKRLEILNKTNDGFKIASEDLKLRGPGDLFGIRQSGLMDFGLGDIYQDAAILQKANEAAEWLLKNNPEYVQQIPDYEGTSSVII